MSHTLHPNQSIIEPFTYNSPAFHSMIVDIMLYIDIRNEFRQLGKTFQFQFGLPIVDLPRREEKMLDCIIILNSYLLKMYFISLNREDYNLS